VTEEHKLKAAVWIALFASLATIGARAASPVALDGAPTIYIAASDGFDTDIIAAITKKKTPVRVVEDKAKAECVLDATAVSDHEESTGGKVARCLFMDCIGMAGNSSVSVKMIKSSDSSVVWAYQVRKGLSGPLARQSLSEAIAKHLRQYFKD
jgi:hypothetical protein